MTNIEQEPEELQIIIDYAGTLATKLHWQLLELSDFVDELKIRSTIKITNMGGVNSKPYPHIGQELVRSEIWMPTAQESEDLEYDIVVPSYGEFRLAIKDKVLNQRVRDSNPENFETAYAEALNQVISSALFDIAALEERIKRSFALENLITLLDVYKAEIASVFVLISVISTIGFYGYDNSPYDTTEQLWGHVSNFLIIGSVQAALAYSCYLDIQKSIHEFPGVLNELQESAQEDSNSIYQPQDILFVSEIPRDISRLGARLAKRTLVNL